MTSIIALHHQTERIIGELNNEGKNVFWDDSHIHGLDGEHHYQFTMPSTIKEAEYFDELSRILVPLEDGGFEEFIIYETEVNMKNEKIVYAIAAYTDMDRDLILNPGTYNGTLREMVAFALPSTEWQVVTVESNAIRTLHLTEAEGAYAFLMKVAKLFEMEMRFIVHTSGNRISGRQVDFVQRFGFDTKKEIEYSKDLLGIEKKVFSDRIVTALQGYGPEKDDGTRLTSYIEDDAAFQRWNRRGKHRVGIYVPESEQQDMTQAQLNQYTKTELNKRIASVVEYTITAAAIENIFPHEKVRLGDRVRVKNPEFTPPLYADARIIRVERSIVDKSKKTYTIGEVKTYTEEDVMRVFRGLQRLYGTKLIQSETAPDGQPKTIWIDTGTPLNVPHVFNSVTNEWEKFAPTSADEIGGLIVGRQYNGVAITPEQGLVVDRTDGLVKTVVNATEGISIQSRAKDTGTYQKVFFADENGNLTFAGIINGAVFTSANKDSSLRIEGGDIRLDSTNGRYLNLNPQGMTGFNSAGNILFQANQTWVTTGIVGTTTTNFYMTAYGEARAVHLDSLPGGGGIYDYTYIPIRAEGFKGNYLDANNGVASEHIYLRPQSYGEVRATALGTSGTYVPIRASVMHAGMFNSTTDNAYIGASDEVRMVDKNITSSYIDVRARGFFGTFMTADPGLYVYLGTDLGLRVTSRGLAGAGPIYRDVTAASFSNGSRIESKEDIELWDEDALALINQSDITSYYLKGDLEQERVIRKYGLVIGGDYNTPKQVINGDGIDQYAMTTLSWKAIQQMTQEIEDVKAAHAEEVKTLNEKYESLLSRVEALEKSSNS